MAKKISELTGGGAAQTGDLIPVSRGTATVSLTAANLMALAADVAAVAPLTASGGTISTEVASGNLLGRYSSGTGAAQEIVIGSGLTLSGFGTLTAAGTVAASAPLAASGGTVTHNTSGVTASNYGNAGEVPSITVNDTGHVTSVSTAAIRTATGARLARDSAFSVDDFTDTAIVWTDEVYDAGDLADLGTNDTRLTAAEAGIYQVGAHVAFEANATGVRIVSLTVNGSTLIGRVSREGVDSGWESHLSIVTEWEFDADDYIETIVFQNSGTAIDVVRSGNATPAMWMRRMI